MTNDSNYLLLKENIENENNHQINLNSISFSPIPYNIIKKQMTYLDFCKTYTREQRIYHCNQLEITNDYNHTHHIAQEGKNKGKYVVNSKQMVHATNNLKKLILDLYNIELIGNKTLTVHLCHLCNLGSTSNCACTNALHTYFGTASENVHDINPDIRKKGGKNLNGRGVKIAINNGTHVSQKKYYCQWCQITLIGDKRNFEKWHNNNCRFNPLSYRFKN